MNLAEHDSGTKRSAIFEELRRNILEKRYANGKLPSERPSCAAFPFHARTYGPFSTS